MVIFEGGGWLCDEMGRFSDRRALGHGDNRHNPPLRWAGRDTTNFQQSEENGIQRARWGGEWIGMSPREDHSLSLRIPLASHASDTLSLFGR